jgi:D-apiose dehydrogenase
MRQSGPLIGIGIGAGYFAQFHYDAWARMAAAGDAEMAAVLALDPAQAKATAEAHGIPTFHAIEELAAVVDRIKPDFVDIIAPPPAHLELVRFFAERGIAIQCQKPLGRNLAEAEEIVSIVSAAGVPFMVHENWRWQPWYRTVRGLVGEGAPLGPLFSLSGHMRMGDGWQDDAYMARQPYFRDYPRLLLFETGIHYLDAYRSLAGEIESVTARIQRRNPAIKGEDAAQIMIAFQSGATAMLDMSRYNESEHANPRHTFGTMRADCAGGHVRFDEDGALWMKRLGQPVEQVDFEAPTLGFAGDCVMATIHHFIGELKGNQQFETGGTEYLKSIRAMEACYQSAATGQTVYPGEIAK